MVKGVGRNVPKNGTGVNEIKSMVNEGPILHSPKVVIVTEIEMKKRILDARIIVNVMKSNDVSKELCSNSQIATIETVRIKFI